MNCFQFDAKSRAGYAPKSWLNVSNIRMTITIVQYKPNHTTFVQKTIHFVTASKINTTFQTQNSKQVLKTANDNAIVLEI